MKTIHHTLLDNGVTLTQDLYFTQLWSEDEAIFTVNGIHVPGLTNNPWIAQEDPRYYEYYKNLFSSNPGYFPLVSSWDEVTYWTDSIETFIGEEEIISGGIVIPADPNAPIQIATIGSLEERTETGWATSFSWESEDGEDDAEVFYRVFYYELPLTPANATIADVRAWAKNSNLIHRPYTTTSPLRSAEFGVDLNPVECAERIQELEGMMYSQAEISRTILSDLYSLSLRLPIYYL